MKQATASCIRFSKELTKYNVNVATHAGKLDSSKSMQRTIEHVRRNALQHQTKIQAAHCRCLHDSPRNARSQAWCSTMAEASFLVQELMRKINKMESTRRFLTASRMMMYFMQASYNIIGRKNGANIWSTSEQLIFRTKHLQNNWNNTLRHVFSVPSTTYGQRTHNPSRLPSNHTGYRQHEQRSRSDSRSTRTTSLPRGSGPRETRLAYVVNRISDLNSTQASSRIRRGGMSRETEKQ